MHEMPPSIVAIDTTHPLYGPTVDLRVLVLRESLGMSRETVFFPYESESHHFVALENENVIGCVLFYPRDGTHGKLYQMAIRPSHQGAGVGRLLVRKLETHAHRLGIRCIDLNARATAVGFYERLGYACVGAPFLEIGIEHRNMVKTLDA